MSCAKIECQGLLGMFLSKIGGGGIRNEVRDLGTMEVRFRLGVTRRVQAIRILIFILIFDLLLLRHRLFTSRRLAHQDQSLRRSGQHHSNVRRNVLPPPEDGVQIKGLLRGRIQIAFANSRRDFRIQSRTEEAQGAAAEGGLAHGGGGGVSSGGGGEEVDDGGHVHVRRHKTPRRKGSEMAENLLDRVPDPLVPENPDGALESDLIIRRDDFFPGFQIQNNIGKGPKLLDKLSSGFDSQTRDIIQKIAARHDAHGEEHMRVPSQHWHFLRAIQIPVFHQHAPPVFIQFEQHTRAAISEEV
mmetsp:Transcript_14681/g.25839  ORF Transcript_14681/g.25839 Transcript_14681/m.25839 type:complete len:300 (-) Transcript_14681:610-1509(-)